MFLKVKDIESSNVYSVDESGAVLGRERARTDIYLKNEAISKQHARIFLLDKEWYIEDLGSSNGTYYRDERISKPLLLEAGMVVSLAEHKFRVVSIEYGGLEGGGLVPQPLGDAPEVLGGRQLWTRFFEAIVHFCKATPKLALMAPHSLRKTCQEQVYPEMSSYHLAIYSLVPALWVVSFTSYLGWFSAAWPMIFVAWGYTFHWVVGKLISLGGGHSSARSRTNFALDVFSWIILTSLAGLICRWLHYFPVELKILCFLVVISFVGLLGVYLLLRWGIAFKVSKLARVFIVFTAGFGLLFTVWLVAHEGVLAAHRDIILAPEKVSEFWSEFQKPESLGTSSEPLRNGVSTDYGARHESACCVDDTIPNKRRLKASPFQSFLARRDAIEEAMDREPSLLLRRDVFELYSEIWKTTYEIRERWKSLMKGKPRWEREKVLKRKQNLEVFKKTKRDVRKLFNLLEMDD